MNENEPMGIARLEEAFRRQDALYLQKYPSIKPPVPRRWMAAILAAIFLLFSTLGISAVRESLMDFAAKIYREFIEIFFDEEISQHDQTEYMISSLPEGYTLLTEYRGKNEYKRVWQHENGDILILLQLPSDAKITLDNEDSEQKIFDVGHQNILCFEKNDKRIYCWRTSSNFLTLTVPITLSEEEGLALIRSLCMQTVN